MRIEIARERRIVRLHSKVWKNKKMLRREFFSFASVAAVATPQMVNIKPSSLAALISEVRQTIENEMPDVTSIEVTYDPEDQKVPLMILAFRV